MYKGSDIDVAELGWLIPRKKVDINELLASTLETDSTNTNQFFEQNNQYKKLYQPD
jgi:hypothetical protein